MPGWKFPPMSADRRTVHPHERHQMLVVFSDDCDGAWVADDVACCNGAVRHANGQFVNCEYFGVKQLVGMENRIFLHTHSVPHAGACGFHWIGSAGSGAGWADPMATRPLMALRI